MSAARPRAAFLDRDGTINVEVDYLSRVEDLRLIPGAASAIARLNRAGIKVVVVTNQSGLARGYFGLEDLAAIHAELDRLLAAEGAHIDAYYFCPHFPEGEVAELTRECDCRKPAPGMILRARDELGLELTGSFMVGDRNGDMACGRAAGLTTIMVATGHDDGGPTRPPEEPDYLARDLAQAVAIMLDGGEGGT